MDEDTALSLAAVFAAVKTISETVAMLPWRVFEENGNERNLQAGTELDRVLHRQPNQNMTAFSFKEFEVACALLWGNAYAEIERNGAGQVVNLYPIHPSLVTAKFDDNNNLFYEVMDNQGNPTPIPARQMFHLRGPTKDGIVGRSVISLARDSWGYGIAADQFASAFLGNGGAPSLIIEPQSDAPEMSKEAIDNMIESIERRHKGSKNAGKVAYGEFGHKITTVGIPQKDAQFIEQRQHSVVDVARWFRLPPHKIQSMEAATYSNIEQQSIEYVTDAINPWVERMEQEADIKLVDNPRWITKMNVNGLLRGDSAARAAFYTSMFNLGAYSPNRILELEDENPVPGGDQRFVPLNMVSLEQASQQQTTNPSQAMREVIFEAHDRMVSKEKMAFNRAVSQDKNLSEWCVEFYTRHEDQMRQALYPGAKALGEFLNVAVEKIDKVLQDHINQHIEISKHDVINERWDDDRATKSTDKLIERLASYGNDAE